MGVEPARSATSSELEVCSQERSAMIRPSLVLLTFFLLTLGAAAGAEAAELIPSRSGTVAQHRCAGPGFYLNLFKFVPVLVRLPALDLDHRLGRARHQGAEQPQVRDLEQRGLFLGCARAGPGVRDPDLPLGPGPAAPGVLRPALDLRLRAQPDGPRRPEGADALPLG